MSKYTNEELVEIATNFYASVAILNEVVDDLINTGIITHQPKQKVKNLLNSFSRIDNELYQVFKKHAILEEEYTFVMLFENIKEIMRHAKTLDVNQLALVVECIRRIKERGVSSEEFVINLSDYALDVQRDDILKSLRINIKYLELSDLPNLPVIIESRVSLIEKIQDNILFLRGKDGTIRTKVIDEVNSKDLLRLNNSIADYVDAKTRKKENNQNIS